MGVQHLQTLLREHDLLREVSLSGQQLVIDGAGLYHHLYARLDKDRGGDYPAFRDRVDSFFGALSSCDITPYVVLDGAKPREKQGARREVQGQGGGTAGAPDIIPPLVKDVFIQVLISRGIEFEMCLGEADWTTAQRAKQRGCPVLSLDTDFCIYDLQNGFLPLECFNWKETKENKNKREVSAKRYQISEFCGRFSLKRHILPVFAALAGNPRSVLTEEEKVPRLEHILKSLKTSKLNKSTSRDEKVLQETLKRFGITDPHHSLRAINSYELEESDEAEQRPDLPQWVTEAVRGGRLTSFVISALTDEPHHHIRRAFCDLVNDRGRLETLERLDQEPRRQQLFDVLGVGDPPENIPEELQLPACGTRFWFQRCPENRTYVDALLLWFVYRHQETEDLPPAGETGWTRVQHKRRKLAHSTRARQNLCGPASSSAAETLNKRVAHAFSQWQACMRQSFYLNQLLRFPLPDPDLARLYSGPEVHRLAELNGGTDVMQRLDPEQRELFKKLKAFVTA